MRTVNEEHGWKTRDDLRNVHLYKNYTNSTDTKKIEVDEKKNWTDAVHYCWNPNVLER